MSYCFRVAQKICAYQKFTFHSSSCELHSLPWRPQTSDSLLLLFLPSFLPFFSLTSFSSFSPLQRHTQFTFPLQFSCVCGVSIHILLSLHFSHLSHADLVLSQQWELLLRFQVTPLYILPNYIWLLFYTINVMKKKKQRGRTQHLYSGGYIRHLFSSPKV